MGGQVDRRWIILAVFAVAAAGVVAAILISRSGGSSDSTTTSADAGGCKQVEAPKPKQVSLKAPKQTVKAGEKLTAAVRTSCGTFYIALDTKRAPETTNSFAYLAEQGFYDGLTFHRIVPGFGIQGGDPLATGTAGARHTAVEKPPAHPPYTQSPGGMAKGPAH